MIDWGKIGPANSPTPTTPDTTTPVAPAAPGSLAAPTGSGLLGLAPTVGPEGVPSGYEAGNSGTAWKATQADVDAMDPAQRIGRGIDVLGNALFGQGNGSPLGGIPVLGDIVGGVGNIGHTVGDWTVAKPLEVAGNVLSGIPLSAVPGGADDSFRDIGAKLADPNLQHDPFYAEAYHQWQLIKAASDADFFHGGNMKGDFNAEFLKAQDDRQHDSQLGWAPDFALGKAEVGSVGGALSLAIESFLGLAGGGTQRVLGSAGVFNPDWSTASFEDMLSYQTQKDAGHEPTLAFGHPTDAFDYAYEQMKAGNMTQDAAKAYVEKSKNENRIQEATRRFESGQEVSDVEKKAVEAVKSGLWSEDHAMDYIVSHGQSVTRNLVGQIAGGLVTDPLTYATLGAGSVAKAGTVGKTIMEAGGIAKTAGFAEKAAFAAEQATNFDKARVLIGAVQQDAALGPAFRIARGMFDPLAVYKPSTVARATTDLLDATSLSAFQRTYGPAVYKLRAMAREAGITPEIDSAIASYTKYQGLLLSGRKLQKDMLEQGLGIEMVHTPVDEAVELAARNAPRDAETMLVDHMTAMKQNVFGAERDADLANRLATTFGKTSEEWAKQIPDMSPDLKSALHAVTYEKGGREFAEALGKVDTAAYKGDVPLRNATLISAESLDNVTAEAVIKNIRAILSGEEHAAKIATASKVWNDLGMRYPKLANLGYATGGKQQLEDLVKALEKELERGGIMRRMTEDELNDPVLRPLRDMLDRHSVPGAPLTSEEQAIADSLVNPPLTPGEGVAKAPKGMASSTLKNGGGTFDAATGKPLTPGTGYAVATGQQGKVVAAKAKDINEAYVEVSKTGAPHIGTWLNPEDGMVYVDPTQVVDDLEEAMKLAQARGEKAIFDFSTMEDIPVAAREAQLGVKRNWNIGFRPDEEVAWGLKQDVNTGRYVVDRDPTISRIYDAVPGRNPFSDTTRNVLGQTIGRSAAARLNKPIEALEAMTNTMRDSITGTRLVLNMEQRFTRSMFDAGIPEPLTKLIWTRAREVAGLDTTTIRGIKPDNLWKVIADDIPRDLRSASGEALNVHVVMDHLLRAAEGDLRIMGVTSKLSQRMRNALRQLGADPSNIGGQMTVTMYNRLRYSQPMFLIQRITDAPYYSILYGVTPVGKGALKGANAELEAITENLGRSGMARDFSMDMPEYATRSNFSAGIKSSMQEMGLREARLEAIRTAPDTIIANNMTNMLHARLGDIVRGVLDNLATAAEKGDPALLEDMLRAQGTLEKTFADLREVYSRNAGRVLDDNEVGLQYIKDQLNAWRRHQVRADGTIDMSKLIHEGERSLPSSIADIGPIRPDDLAKELGYADAASLRRDVVGHVEKINGQFVVVKGENDIARLEERLTTELNAHPDYVRRATAYFGSTWEDYWSGLARSVEEGGLDITPHYAKEAQEFIMREAQSREMDPWEYLSGVMASNIGGKDLQSHIGQLMGFLKAGKSAQPMEEWSRIFRGSLDQSAQRTLLDEFRTATGTADPAGILRPAKFEMVTPKSAPGAKPRPPVAELPKTFKAEPGYAYRVETPEAMEMGLPTKSGVTVGKPTAFYNGKDDIEKAIYRIKDDGTLATGRHGAGGGDRLTTAHVPPEQIEMLTEDGKWVALSADPYDNFFAHDFPNMVRQRILDGAPHANPEVEAYVQQFSKWVNDNIKGELSERTRADLRQLVENVPTHAASPFNRSQALVVHLLKSKIEDAQQDIFRLAEMQTQRTVIERSLNHPLFGLYPASYMWGKVLPETVKFLAKNPYAATYLIADVQRAIAIQREYNPEMEDAMNTVDRSSAAFLLDYLTPGLPWSDHSARMSPMVRDLLGGKDLGTIWSDELATVSPQRWVSTVVNAGNEIPGAIDQLTQPQEAPEMSGLQSLAGGSGGSTSSPTTNGGGRITGPTPAAALAPILADDLARLQSILISGKPPEE